MKFQGYDTNALRKGFKTVKYSISKCNKILHKSVYTIHIRIAEEAGNLLSITKRTNNKVHVAKNMAVFTSKFSSKNQHIVEKYLSYLLDLKIF